MKNKTLTINESNIVKGIAIIFMMFHHLFLSPDRYEGFEISFWPMSEFIVNDIALLMRICVSLFVFISAYGITIKLRDKSIKEIIIISFQRYVKMITNFWVAYLFVLIVDMVGWDGIHTLSQFGNNKYTPLYMLIDLLGISDILTSPTLIGTYWYMSMATLIIFTVPCLLSIYRKLGFPFILFLISISYAIEWKYIWYSRYLLCILLGIAFANNSLFEKISILFMRSKKSVKALIFSCGIILSIILCLIKLSNLQWSLMQICDGILVVLLSEFVILINNYGYFSRILAFIGVHSMNIFWIHSFIRHCWMREFIYGLKYPLICTIILLLISLLISLILEKIKDICMFSRLQSFIGRSIEKGVKLLSSAL